MLVFHIGILTETERSKVAKRKTATHLNKLIIFFFLITEQQSHIKCIHVEQKWSTRKSRSCSIQFLIAMRGAAPSWQSPTALPLLCCPGTMLWLGRGRDGATRGYHKPSRVSRQLGRPCAQRDVLMLLTQIWSLPCQLAPSGQEAPSEGPCICGAGQAALAETSREERKLVAGPSRTSTWKTTNYLVSRSERRLFY